VIDGRPPELKHDTNVSWTAWPGYSAHKLADLPFHMVSPDIREDQLPGTGPLLMHKSGSDIKKVGGMSMSRSRSRTMFRRLGLGLGLCLDVC